MEYLARSAKIVNINAVEKVLQNHKGILWDSVYIHYFASKSPCESGMYKGIPDFLLDFFILILIY